MEVIGVAADTAPSSGKGVSFGAFGGGGVTAMVVEVLLGVGGFHVDRGTEMTMFNTNIYVHPASPSFCILYHTNRHFRVLTKLYYLSKFPIKHVHISKFLI